MQALSSITVTARPMPSSPHPQSAFAEVEALGERIALLSAQIQAATYQLLVMIREFDERGGWGEGFRSCAHWLNWRTGLDLGAAREKVRVARALAELPRLSASMRKGEISYSKVRALTRVATAANEAELLDFARAGTAAHVERLVRAWRRVDRIAEMEHEERRHAGRSLFAYTDEDGMVVVRGRLTAEAGAALLRALDAAGEKLYERRRVGERDATGEEPSAEQRRADALGLVAESALAGGLDPGSRGDRFQVVVHVGAEALRAGGADETAAAAGGRDVSAETRPLLVRATSPNAGSRVSAEIGPRRDRALALPEAPGPATPTGRLAALAAALADGPDVSAETSRRLACDAAKVVMHHAADGSVLDVGRRTRTIPPALRRALAHRDAGCRFPGCGLKLCDAHHVEHWADGGATRLDNLIRLCRRHHRAVHEEGFGVELLAGGEARFRRPDGRAIEEAPALPGVAGDAAATLARRLARQAVRVDPQESLPSWDGGPVEIGWAIEGMRPAAASGG